jgi:hypothetical protein
VIDHWGRFSRAARLKTLSKMWCTTFDFNPIELVFHPRKAFLRKAAERTIDGLNRRIGSFIRALAPSQCIEYFRHAGYEPA